MELEAYRDSRPGAPVKDAESASTKRLRESMVLFKSCPRCAGDRILEQDFYGWYMLCLACGHVAYPQQDPEAVRSTKPARTPSADVVPVASVSISR